MGLHTHLRLNVARFNLDLSENKSFISRMQLFFNFFEKMQRYISVFSFAADKSYSDVVQQARLAVEVVEEFRSSSVETSPTLSVSSHKQHLIHV